MASIILGCGDVGRRIARRLIAEAYPASEISAYVRTAESAEICSRIGVMALRLDLDDLQRDMGLCQGADLYYTVAPQKAGTGDERSRALLTQFKADDVKPRKIVLISTTGVYGDCDGDWVTEASATNPQTERGQRRLDSETQWLEWGYRNRVPVVVLRVPGIYAYSRLPRERLIKRTPVVKAEECGYTNRIHADDLASVCVLAMQNGKSGEVYNVTDGVPGKISEYLQAAAHVLGMEPLPEISMQQAESELSAGMLSYLGESRKISNRKMLDELGVQLKYPDFKQGIKY